MGLMEMSEIRGDEVSVSAGTYFEYVFQTAY